MYNVTCSVRKNMMVERCIWCSFLPCLSGLLPPPQYYFKKVERGQTLKDVIGILARGEEPNAIMTLTHSKSQSSDQSKASS